MRKGFIWLLTLLFIYCLPGSAQEADNREVFAPFVSRLKAKTDGSSILLSWKDSVDVDGQNLVYRFTEEINQENIDQAELLANVEMGEETYVDFPLDTQSYFYTVLVESSEGNPYSLFIPFRNKTLNSVAIDRVGEPEQRAAKITQIVAESSGESITVRFETSLKSRELLLFRSASPYREYSDLAGGVSWLLSNGSTLYEDKPPAGIGYYYTVLDAELVQLGKVEIIPGTNSTQFAAQVPLAYVSTESVSDRTLRTMPLPFLIISREVESGNDLSPPLRLPGTRRLAAETTVAVEKLLSIIPQSSAEEKKPEVLAIDRVPRPEGHAYILKSIIDGSLLTGQYRTAEENFTNFLQVRRTDDLESRARFYIGQSYYFQGRYRKALIEFLMALDLYYREVHGWLDACFERLLEEVP